MSMMLPTDRWLTVSQQWWSAVIELSLAIPGSMSLAVPGSISVYHIIFKHSRNKSVVH